MEPLAASVPRARGCARLPGPSGATTYHYGEGVAPAAAELVSLEASLEPLREAFDAHVDVPRVLALMPHMGCERGAAILRSEVLDAHRGEDLRLFVIWQDVARTPDAAQAAARANRSLDDDRVIAFHDGSGRAGRAFARGKLPVAEAREVFLFYPAGASWPRSSDARRTLADRVRTPATDDWVHQLGRVRPEKYCTPGISRARCVSPSVASSTRPASGVGASRPGTSPTAPNDRTRPRRETGEPRPRGGETAQGAGRGGNRVRRGVGG